MEALFATDASTSAALSSAFPQLDFSMYGALPGEPSGSPGGAAQGPIDIVDILNDDVHDAMFEDEAPMAVDADDEGASRDVQLGTSAVEFASAGSEAVPLGHRGAPGPHSVRLGAEDSGGAGAGAEDAGTGHGTAMSLVDLPSSPEPSVPELPADGGCLRATHLRSTLPSDAALDAVRSACAGLGHVVSPVSEVGTVLCTATDALTGAPVDYTVQVFTQRGCGDRVLEIQHGGRGDRLAFVGIYADVADRLRAEAGCEAQPLPELEASPIAAAESLGPPPSLSLSSRGATVGASGVSRGASAPAAAGAPRALWALTGDVSVPGEDGLALLASRLRSSSRGSEDSKSASGDAAECAEAVSAVTARVASMAEADAAETCARLDSTRVPQALLDVLAAATSAADAGPVQPASAAAGDAAVVPSIVALGRLLAAPGSGCSTLTGSGRAAAAALAALSDAARAAALQYQDACVELARKRGGSAAAAAASAVDSLPHHLAGFADVSIVADDVSSLPVLGASGDGPAAMTPAWLAAAGAVLRLRAAASALSAAASRPGVAPEGAAPSAGAAAEWAAAVAEAAGPGIASLVASADAAGDRTLSALVAELKSAVRC